MAEIIITKDNFENEVLKADKTVLLDFWASWCGPCRMLAPVVAQLAEKYEGTVIVGKVNVDEEPELANAFRVESIPMLAVLKNGTVTGTSVGYQPQAALEELIR